MQGRDAACSTFSYLTGRLIAEACECAEGARDFHLALLVAQACGAEEGRTMLHKQLVAWADSQVRTNTTALLFCILADCSIFLYRYLSIYVALNNSVSCFV